MAAVQLPHHETTINGPRTKLWALDATACPELGTHRIARLGIDVAHAPYNRVRLRPAGSFFFACIEGEGLMLLEGRWQRVTAGELCMAPPRVLNALHAVPGKPWTFAWLRYEEPHYVKALVGSDSPLRLRRGADDFARVIQGLRSEWEAERDPSLLHHWVSMLQGLARRLAKPWRCSSRVEELWEMVGRDLTVDWKLSLLAKASSLSDEHLRRLCRRELGRTPMEHVTYMRMRRAQDLLEESDEKLEAIAPMVGYNSATVFSRAFARCIGMSPTEYRTRG
ncbi:MAG: AraC family transcriptional regulator [Armatimonadetes bacterium]|nr:AraC family transcriptional regulator [Akkermansiaceae bacterium]